MGLRRRQPGRPDHPRGHTPRIPVTLRGRLGAGDWVNLFRRADPLGFRLYSESDSEEDRYVSELDERLDLNTHSGYHFTPEYETAINEWVRGWPPSRTCWAAPRGADCCVDG